jgi:hypothetical protein
VERAAAAAQVARRAAVQAPAADRRERQRVRATGRCRFTRGGRSAGARREGPVLPGLCVSAAPRARRRLPGRSTLG